MCSTTQRLLNPIDHVILASLMVVANHGWSKRWLDGQDGYYGKGRRGWRRRWRKSFFYLLPTKMQIWKVKVIFLLDDDEMWGRGFGVKHALLINSSVIKKYEIFWYKMKLSLSYFLEWRLGYLRRIWGGFMKVHSILQYGNYRILLDATVFFGKISVKLKFY